MIDVVIISNAKDFFHREITENTLKTLMEATNMCLVNPIVIESSTTEQYGNTTTIHPKESFGYNKYLNIGAKAGNSEFIAFCNNDLEFTNGWADKIIEAMNLHGLDSASPFCKINHNTERKRVTPNIPVRFGNRVGFELCGWCIVMRRSTWEELGGFDEDFIFWCADNSYQEQIFEHKLKHALICDARVTHINGGGNHINEIKRDDFNKYSQLTMEEVYKYNKKYGRNLFDAGVGKQ